MVLPGMGVLPRNKDSFSMTAGSAILAPFDVWYNLGPLVCRIFSKNFGAAFRSRPMEVVEVALVKPLSTDEDEPKFGLKV